MNKKKTFSTAEYFLIGLLILLLIGIPYYFFVHTVVTEGVTAAQAERDNYENEILLSSAKIAKLNKMKAYLEEKKADKSVSAVQLYDNQSEVMNFLYGVLLDKTESLVINQSVTLPSSGYIVRRNMAISFKCASYELAEAIVEELEASSFLNQITVLTISRVGEQDAITEGPVSVNLSIVFFEDNSAKK